MTRKKNPPKLANCPRRRGQTFARTKRTAITCPTITWRLWRCDGHVSGHHPRSPVISNCGVRAMHVRGVTDAPWTSTTLDATEMATMARSTILQKQVPAAALPRLGKAQFSPVRRLAVAPARPLQGSTDKEAKQSVKAAAEAARDTVNDVAEDQVRHFMLRCSAFRFGVFF